MPVLVTERSVDVITFTMHPKFLNLSLSPAQRALLKSIYGMDLTDEERDFWWRFTGRAEYPGEPFAEVTLVSGTRGGKGSRCQAPCMLYEALMGGFEPDVGETLVVPIVAQDQPASRIVFKMVKDMLARAPLLKPFVVSALKNIITLSNGIEIRAYPSTSRAIHGYSICAAALDELGRFRFEGAADSDADVESAVLRGMTAYMRGKDERALLVKASTPTSRSGVLYRDYQQAFGKPVPHLLVWQAPSIVMNPSEVSPEHVAREMARDPVRARRLYLAEFSEDVGAFLPGEAIEQAVQPHVHEIPPVEGATYTFACDPAGSGKDAMALSGVMLETDESGRQRVVQVVQRSWANPRGGAFDQEAAVREVAAVMRTYGVKVIYGDRYGSSLVVQAFERRGIEYTHPHITTDGKASYVDKSRGYLEAGVLFRTGNISILDDETTVAELRSLERRGEKVDAFSGHEDRANALCLAACMAVANATRGWGLLPAWSHTKSYTPRSTAAATRTNVEEGIEVKGERYRDPRGDEPTAAPAPIVHAVDDASHRVECRQCRAAWRCRP